MNNLLEDVVHSYEQLAERAGPADKGGMSALTITEDDEIVPGFFAMREYNTKRMKVMMRRGYREFAGAPLPETSQETFELTRQVLCTLVTSVVVEAFCDGVQVGQQKSHIVRMSMFYDKLPEVFTHEGFRMESAMMALQFTKDAGVRDFFTEQTLNAAAGLAQVTGFAHNTGVSHKIWDLWLLTGNSGLTGSYIAGCTLGELWKEREVLSEMESEITEDKEEGDDNSA